MKYTRGDLKQRQSLPLDAKIVMTEKRIQEWYEHFDGNVYVSFSGGKDSTVLLTIARHLYPDIEAVFVDTGLEYPEIRKFVKTFDNVTILRPKMRFDEVIKQYGYPIISKEVAYDIEYARKGSQWAHYKFEGKNADGTDSKRKKGFRKYAPLIDTNITISNKCCTVMKKQPLKIYERQTGKKPIVATLAEESGIRENAWLQNGCNAFDSQRAISQPMAFWTEQDILHYIKTYEIPIASVYGQVIYKQPTQIGIDEILGGFDGVSDELITTGCDRTGCMFCAFGCHLEKSPTKFEKLKLSHPKQYNYCIYGGG